MSGLLGKKITEKFLSNIWLFENVLWKYSDHIAIDQGKENIKKILYEVYDFKDIYEIVPKQLNGEGVDRFLKTVFTFHEKEIDNDKK